MTATKLPSVLQQPHGNSLSVERVLKQALKLLSGEETFPDELSVCCEDLETLLANLDRS